MDLSFIFKKFVGIHITPMGLGFEAIALGFILVAYSFWRRRKAGNQSRGKRSRCLGGILVVFGSLFLYLCSLTPVANFLLYSLEKQNPPLEKKDGNTNLSIQPECIVVLAGGAFSSQGSSAISGLSGPTLGRVTEGIVYWKEFPNCDFIVTGRGLETRNMANVAVILGVDSAKIVIEDKSKDTKDHPVKLKPIIGGRPFLLVTSASHMPRSLALFRKQGLDPIAAPVFFRTPKPGSNQAGRPLMIDALIPFSENLEKTNVAMHEFYGLLWGQIRGQIN